LAGCSPQGDLQPLPDSNTTVTTTRFGGDTLAAQRGLVRVRAHGTWKGGMPKAFLTLTLSNRDFDGTTIDLSRLQLEDSLGGEWVLVSLNELVEPRRAVSLDRPLRVEAGHEATAEIAFARRGGADVAGQVARFTLPFDQQMGAGMLELRFRFAKSHSSWF
jgi:hypothetical protein